MKVSNFLPLLLVSAAGSVANSEPLRVSMVEVLANPERFDGKQIFVAGYVFVQGDEDRALFLHCDDLQNWNAANGLRLEIPESLLSRVRNGVLVMIEGTFTLSPGKRWIRWSPGSVTKITKIEPWPLLQKNVCEPPMRR